MQKCILVVDDDEMNLSRTRIILRKDGYDVLLATSGMEALHMLKRHHVDLVLLDIEDRREERKLCLSWKKNSPRMRPEYISLIRENYGPEGLKPQL